jgi:hypothetical protein
MMTKFKKGDKITVFDQDLSLEDGCLEPELLYDVGVVDKVGKNFLFVRTKYWVPGWYLKRQCEKQKWLEF